MFVILTLSLLNIVKDVTVPFIKKKKCESIFNIYISMLFFLTYILSNAIKNWF